jgi:hypothetical protein
MAQRTGGKLDPRRLLRRVSAEAAARLSRQRQLGSIDFAELDHAGMQRRDGVPFAHQEVVRTPGVLAPFVETQEVEEQRRHQVGARHRSADVSVIGRRGGHDVAS